MSDSFVSIFSPAAHAHMLTAPDHLKATTERRTASSLERPSHDWNDDDWATGIDGVDRHDEEEDHKERTAGTDAPSQSGAFDYDEDDDAWAAVESEGQPVVEEEKVEEERQVEKEAMRATLKAAQRLADPAQVKTPQAMTKADVPAGRTSLFISAASLSRGGASKSRAGASSAEESSALPAPPAAAVSIAALTAQLCTEEGCGRGASSRVSFASRARLGATAILPGTAKRSASMLSLGKAQAQQQQGRCSWHSPEGDVDNRQEMVKKIATLLSSRKRCGLLPSRKWISELPHKARRLEEALYLRAPSLEAYLDQKTLKARLGKVASDIAARFQEKKRRRRSSLAEAAVGIGVDSEPLSSAQRGVGLSALPPPAKKGRVGVGAVDRGRLPSTSGIGTAATAIVGLRPLPEGGPVASVLNGADVPVAAASSSGGDGTALDSLPDRILRDIREQKQLLLGMKKDSSGDLLNARGVTSGMGASGVGLLQQQRASMDFGRMMMPEASVAVGDRPFVVGADTTHHRTEQMMEAVRQQGQMLLAQKQHKAGPGHHHHQQQGNSQWGTPPRPAGQAGAEMLPPLAAATPGAAHARSDENDGQDWPESLPIVPELFDW